VEEVKSPPILYILQISVISISQAYFFLKALGSSGWYKVPQQAEAAPLKATNASRAAIKANNFLFIPNASFLCSLL